MSILLIYLFTFYDSCTRQDDVIPTVTFRHCTKYEKSLLNYLDILTHFLTLPQFAYDGIFLCSTTTFFWGKNKFSICLHPPCFSNYSSFKMQSLTFNCTSQFIFFPPSPCRNFTLLNPLPLPRTSGFTTIACYNENTRTRNTSSSFFSCFFFFFDRRVGALIDHFRNANPFGFLTTYPSKK